MKTRTLIKTADNVTEADSLLHSVDAKLTEDEKSLCEKDVTKEEIHKVIKLLKSNKSPGDDGIIAEFYKTYWYLIHNELTFVIKFILENNSLSKSHYNTILHSEQRNTRISSQNKNAISQKSKIIYFL